MIKIKFHAMGSRIEAFLDRDSMRGKKELEKLPAWFEEWEQVLSRFRPGSELSRLNRSPDKEIRVSKALWDVLELAVWAENQSEGLVSPAILPSLIANGYSQSFELIHNRLPGKNGCALPVNGKLAEMILNPCGKTVFLPQGLELDLGGVAKGWAACEAMKRLESYGSAMVNAGGDISISQQMESGDPWQIGIIDPFQPSTHLGVIQIKRGGVATSGRDYRRWVMDGIWMHHLIDPRSGLPAATDVLCATLIAPSVMAAEMAAKIVLILGSQAGMDWLAENPRCAGLMVGEKGEIWNNESLSKYLFDGKKKTNMELIHVG
jgi:FAD:protein FMN transferase